MEIQQNLVTSDFQFSFALLLKELYNFPLLLATEFAVTLRKCLWKNSEDAHFVVILFLPFHIRHYGSNSSFCLCSILWLKTQCTG